MKKRQATAPSSPHVVVYYRRSTLIQDKSIERQQAEVLPHCERKGYTVVRAIQDDGISGSEVTHRPGLQEVLLLAGSKHIQGVVVDDLDRLARLDLLEIGELLSPLRRAGVWIESVSTGRFDFNSMSGRLMLGISSEARRGEQLSIARRSLTERLRLVRDLGTPPAQKPAYGYRRIEDVDLPIKRNGKRHGKIVIEEREAVVVRQIFQWYADGQRLGWICRQLHARSVPTSRGRVVWHRSTLKQILSNRAYVGDRVWGKTSQGKFFTQSKGVVEVADGFGRTVTLPEDEWFIASETHDAIVDRDVWLKVQDRIRDGAVVQVVDEEGNILRKEGECPSPSQEPGAYLLSRMLVCNECGAWFTGFPRPKGKKVNAYLCANYAQHGLQGCVRVEVREAEAVERLVKELRRLLSPERQQFLRDELKERMANAQGVDNTPALRKQVMTLEGQLVRFRSRLMEVSKDMIPEVEEGIRSCRQQLQEAQEALQKAETANPVRDLEVSVQAATDAIWKLEEALSDGDRLALREALKGIVGKVVIGSETYETLTGKQRRRPVMKEVRLKRGTGLDILSDLDSFGSEHDQVMRISVEDVA